MKLFTSISVLSLITLSNITQAFYVTFNDDKPTTSSSICLKLNKLGYLVTRDCSNANQFVLVNNKFCLKKNNAYCMAYDALDEYKTLFTANSARHIKVKELNAGGYLHVDSTNGVIKYKYSAKEKRFITGYDEPIAFPSKDGQWKNQSGWCWTGNSNEYDSIYLSPCRSSKRNIIRGNKIQFWKYDSGSIKSADGVWCLVNLSNRINTVKCSNINPKSQIHKFNLLEGREIASSYRQGMCIVQRSHGRGIMVLGTCPRQVKFVETLA